MTEGIDQIIFRVQHENVETIVRTQQGASLSSLCESHPFMRLSCQIDIDAKLQNAQVRVSQEELL